MKKILSITLAALYLVVLPVVSHAQSSTTDRPARIYFDPSSGTVKKDSSGNIEIKVMVNTGGEDSSGADVIVEFDKKYGCPVIINTSFNVRGEPIVCTPRDAFICFMRTDMDYLVIGPFLLDKAQQKPLEDDRDWRREFELD